MYLSLFPFIVDGSYLLTCGSDKKLKLWNPLTGLLLKTYGGHANEVTDAAGSCDRYTDSFLIDFPSNNTNSEIFSTLTSCFIVSASLDKSIIYWDVSTAQPLRRLRCHAGGVNCVRFNEDSGLAISGGKDNMAMCWDIRTRKQEPIQVLNDAKDCITSIVCNDHEIITSSLDGCIRHYDLRASQLTCDSIGTPIVHMVQTKDGQCMVAACQDNVLRLIDNDSGQILAEYKGHISEDFQIECGILAGDSKICSGSAEGSAVIWNLVDEKEVARIEMGK